MSRENITNVAASVRQKLLNMARGDRRPFNELLQYYAMERFLYRLSCSEYADLFILKGAMMLRIWHSDEYRPTMDIDMLGRTSNAPDAIEQQIEPDSDDIFWICPKCQDRGRISNWRGTIYDMSDIGDVFH